MSRTRRAISDRMMRSLFLLVGVIAACGGTPSEPHAPSAAGDPPVERLPGLDTRAMDPTADPCVDFFRYACGNFAKLHPIQPDRASSSVGVILGEYTSRALHDILEHAAQPRGDRAANEQKIGDAYASCMDAAAIDQRGLAPLAPELARIAALTSPAELPALLAHDQLIGVNALFGFGEQQDYADARKQIAVVSQGGLGLPERDYYLRTGAEDDKLRAAYVAHVGRTLALVGDASSTDEAQAVLALETQLAKISLDITSQRDPHKIYHLMSVRELAALTPGFDWAAFFAATGAPAFTELNVSNPEFFKALPGVLAAVDLPTLKAYLRWQVVAAVPGVALARPLDDEQFAFNGKALSGQQQQQPRWKRCVAHVDNALGEALGEVYVARQFSPANKQATVQMVHDIEAAMATDIDTLDWMSAETKARAHAKLRAVADKIGYPDHFRDYAKLAIARGDALGNATRATEFEARRQLAKIGKPVERGEWGMSPATVDAYYNPSMNDINFPAAILQPPFYDEHSTDAENYGHVGGIVGHELTHGFDDEGRQFDGAGNLADWWTADDGKRFDDKAACEVNEYGGFVAVADVHVNGKLTLGENTADNGGLRLAYAAFLASAARKHLDVGKKIDGFTPAQQFFLGHGQNWCGTMRPERMRLQVQTDPHSPREFRVNGVVQNMPEFGQAFGCKVGQPMMPANACRVW
jgi:putative endopeptidase